MAKKKVKSRSKIGRAFAKLTALPGQEPVFEQPEEKPKPKKHVPKPHIKELRAAVDSVNAAAQKAPQKKSDKNLEQEDIDAEYSEAYCGAVGSLDEHTEKWKKTGETGLFIPPRTTVKERVGKVVDKYKQKRREADKKSWVKMEKVPFKPKQFLVLKSKLSKLKDRFKRKRDEPSVKEVFSEIQKVKVKHKKSDEEIDNIYKQLSK